MFAKRRFGAYASAFADPLQDPKVGVRGTCAKKLVARTNRPVAQLSIYVLALTRLVPGLRLFDIKCARCNETAYNEFFPRKLLPPARKR